MNDLVHELIACVHFLDSRLVDLLAAFPEVSCNLHFLLHIEVIKLALEIFIYRSVLLIEQLVLLKIELSPS